MPTVSRALGDAPDISAETRRLVRQVADEIGYVPNRAGVRLRTGRTNVISLVLASQHDMMNHTARLISSIAGALLGTPYHMIITPYSQSEDPMRPIRYIVETGSADAVIFNQTVPRDPRAAYLMERGFPFATHGRTDWADRHPWFDYDNAAFADIGVRHLARRGRRNIALVAPPLSQNYAQNILDGCIRGAAATGATITRIEGITSDSPASEVRRVAGAFLAARPQTDGAIIASTTATMALVAALEDRGMVLGRDIDVLAKEGMPFLNMFRSAIIALPEDVAHAGEFLARAAIQAIREPGRPPMQRLETPEDVPDP
ncbi:MAG: substrate-binding domain-containing protein [Rubellimicrobium sp.]|nr:substrate-binding domain-containing protein [Rubellimicrobium sp.]